MSPDRRRSGRVLALAYFCLVTAVLLHPVTVAGGRAVPGWAGDNLFYVRHLWWMKHALLDLHVAPFVDRTAHDPIGQNLARGEMSAANTIPALPLTALGGPALAYNVVVLFSFVATGFATCLWVESLTGRLAAGLLAGTIAAFLPFRFAHLAGHLPQLTTQWMPAALYAFERLRERPVLSRAITLGVMLALVVLGSWYYGYSLALLLPLYAVMRCREWPALWREAAWWRMLAMSVAVALALVAPFLVPMLQLSSAGVLHRSLREMQFWALNPYDAFLPNLLHPLWGERVARLFPAQGAGAVERTHALGYASVLLAALGLWRWRRRRPATVLALAAVWAASYAIALGPFLVVGDRMVRVPVPPAVARSVAGLLPAADRSPEVLASIASAGVPVPLPSAALYAVVPFTSAMRVMARFSFWTGLMTAGLAGFGLLSLASAAEGRFGPRAAGAVCAIAVSLVLLESASRVPMLRLPERAVDAWLAAQGDDVVVADLPAGPQRYAFLNYWATRHGRRGLLGWGASFPERVERERQGRLKLFPDPSALAFLKDSTATHLLVTPAGFAEWPRAQAALAADPHFVAVTVVGGVHVFRIVR
jgi:hypothetical protein